MNGRVPETAVTVFIDLALAGEKQKATRVALDLLDAGVPTTTVITDLLAAVQLEVGARWHRGEWSTAEEHFVTGTSQAVLEALATTATPAQQQRGMVVVACAEGDWHSLPAQMFAESLRASGQGVVFLGASTPAEDVAAFIGRRRPDALVVSCALALFYRGTARLVDAAHYHGVPVIAGGAALTEKRAARLGADAWAADAAAAADILRGWRERPPRLKEPAQLDRAALALDANAATIAERAFPRLAGLFPAMTDYDDRQLAHTRQDLIYMVQFIAAARLVDDPSVFTTFETWLTELLISRGVPGTAVKAGLAALAPDLLDIDADAYRLVVAATTTTG